MSTMVCLKDGDTLILGTDSRFVEADLSGVVSDAEQKIFEIWPNTFIATSGLENGLRLSARGSAGHRGKGRLG